MHGTSRKNEICFESLEKALERNPETYGHLFLLCAGWSCQDNSNAGSRKGLQGEKSNVWKEVARVLRLFKPKWFIGENVPGLLSVNNGEDFQEILSDIMEIGYGISWRILNSQYFGVPQQRRRIFFIGYFGEPCPPQILFEQESDKRDSKKSMETRTKCLCITTRDGWKHDPTNETTICSTIRTQESGERTQGYIAETNSKRKGNIAGIPKGLDTNRGIVLGNAVTVNVAEWIGKRILEYEKSH